MRKAVPKAKRGLAIRRARPARGRRPARILKKTIVRQEALGQATENKLSLLSHRSDSRARVIKAVSTPSHYNSRANYSIQGTSSGVNACNLTYFAAQTALSNMAGYLQGTVGINTAGVSSIVQPARFLLENFHGTYTFSNRSSAPCSLKVYVLTSKRDSWYAVPPDQMVYNAPNGQSFRWSGDPMTAFQQGIYAGEGATGSNEWLLPGVVPTMSDIFNSYFKIEREIEVEMAQGGTHRLEINKHYDKLCDASVYGNTPLVGIKGITHFLLFLATGVPVFDTVSASMTTAPVDIGVIETNDYRYTQAWSPAGVVTLTGGLPQDPLANLFQINPGSGASSAIVQA